MFGVAQSPQECVRDGRVRPVGKFTGKRKPHRDGNKKHTRAEHVPRYNSVFVETNMSPPPKPLSAREKRSQYKPFGRQPKAKFLNPSDTRVVYNNGKDMATIHDHLRDHWNETEADGASSGNNGNVGSQFDVHQELQKNADALVQRYKKLMQQPGSKSKVLVANYRHYKKMQKQLARRGTTGSFKGHDRRKNRRTKEQYNAHGF